MLSQYATRPRKAGSAICLVDLLYWSLYKKLKNVFALFLRPSYWPSDSSFAACRAANRANFVGLKPKQLEPVASVNWFAAGVPGGHLNLLFSSRRIPNTAAARESREPPGTLDSRLRPGSIFFSTRLSLYLRIDFCFSS